ncbi:MAG: hypothetical protein NTW82_06000 [Bacteroidia bacterium]|nr:hypothetical protein [Bacteroidia bacterium]
MKYRIYFLLIITFITTTLSNCIKDEYDFPNDIIKGWQLDSIDFNYRWLYPEDVDFIDSKTGYIIGSNGYLLKTTDYARSWEQSDIEKDSLGVTTTTLSFINDSTGFIYGIGNVLNGDYYGTLYKTVDGGKHWTKRHYTTAYRLYSMKFFDSLYATAINYDNSGAHLMRTSDGGESWWADNNLELNQSFKGLFYLGGLSYATGTNQRIYKSTYKGFSWSTINIPKTPANFIRGFYFIDEKTGFVDCVDKKFKTTDGGNTWQEIKFPFKFFSTPSQPFEDFHFCNYKYGIWIVDTSAYIGGDFPSFIGTYVYTTADGGRNWTKSDLLKRFGFGTINFVTNDFAYCISNYKIYTLKKR